MISQQNPDGSWSPVEPLGWRGGLYWEVYDHSAELVGPDRTVAEVRSRWRWLLWVKMFAVALRHVREHNRVRRYAR